MKCKEIEKKNSKKNLIFDNTNYFDKTTIFINSFRREILLSRCDGWILVSNFLELMCPKKYPGFY